MTCLRRILRCDDWTSINVNRHNMRSNIKSSSYNLISSNGYKAQRMKIWTMKSILWDFHCEALSKFVEIPKNHCFLGNVLKFKSLYKANPSASMKFKSKMAFVMLIWNANPLSIRMHIKYHSQLPHHCRIHTHTLRLSMQSRATWKIALDIACIRCKVFWKTMKSYRQNKFAHAQSVCIINYFAMCGCSTIYGTILCCKCGTHYEHYTLVILYPFACPNALPFRRCYSGIRIYWHPCHFTGPRL